MNYIRRLESENRALRLQLQDTRQQLIDLEVYLASSKFTGPDADYVHVSTDILPKISRVRYDKLTYIGDRNQGD